MAAKQSNDDAVKALALRMGASVRLANGETFNASGSRGVITRQAEVAEQKPVAAADELLGKIAEMLAKQQAPVVHVPELPAPTVMVEAPQITVQPAPVPTVTPRAWKFTFERNESGTIRSITATPQL